MRISDWSSDVCSSDLPRPLLASVAESSEFWMRPRSKAIVMARIPHGGADILTSFFPGSLKQPKVTTRRCRSAKLRISWMNWGDEGRWLPVPSSSPYYPRHDRSTEDRRVGKEGVRTG